MSLKYKRPLAYSIMEEEEKKGSYIYSKEYMEFLKVCKTEWETAEYIEEKLRVNGFVNIDKRKSLVPGDKVYFVNKERSIYCAVIGTEEMKNGMLMVGAHIDSPRLDIKPMPLTEKFNIALMKTQYYGGIKKYQWLSIPLAMHGIVYNEKNEKITIVAGEDNDDYCFTIADLLPHLSTEQLKKTAAEFIDPEKMNVIVGSISDEAAKDDKVKENILKILKEKYGINEVDFSRSDIEFVPAMNPKYIGFDKSLIAGYGHDDRICAYAAMKAIINAKPSKKTTVMLAVDKEEIGSFGTTSMHSNTFDMFIKEIMSKSNNICDIDRLYYNSKMLSADVSSCADISSEEVMDPQNSNIVGYGIALSKYGGGNGKANASEASAKYISEIMSLFEKEKVSFQVGNIGKMGKGGGGTIAYILANKGVDVVDCGTAIIGMHSPYEIASVADTYMTYKAYKMFFEKM